MTRDERILKGLLANARDPGLPKAAREAFAKKAEEIRARLDDTDEEEVDSEEQERVQRSLRDGVWITRDGEVMQLQAMEISHLKYAIAFLGAWRRQEKRREKREDLRGWIFTFKRELRRQERLQAKQERARV